MNRDVLNTGALLVGVVLCFSAASCKRIDSLESQNRAARYELLRQQEQLDATQAELNKLKNRKPTHTHTQTTIVKDETVPIFEPVRDTPSTKNDPSFGKATGDGDR